MFVMDEVPFDVVLLVDNNVARVEIAVAHGKCLALSIFAKHVFEKRLLVQAISFRKPGEFSVEHPFLSISQTSLVIDPSSDRSCLTSQKGHSGDEACYIRVVSVHVINDNCTEASLPSSSSLKGRRGKSSSQRKGEPSIQVRTLNGL